APVARQEGSVSQDPVASRVKLVAEPPDAGQIESLWPGPVPAAAGAERQVLGHDGRGRPSGGRNFGPSVTPTGKPMSPGLAAMTGKVARLRGQCRSQGCLRGRR